MGGLELALRDVLKLCPDDAAGEAAARAALAEAGLLRECPRGMRGDHHFGGLAAHVRSWAYMVELMGDTLEVYHEWDDPRVADAAATSSGTLLTTAVVA